MNRKRLRIMLPLLLIAALLGYARLRSVPNYPAQGPPWIAEGGARPVPKIEIRHRVVLIGDAGYDHEGDPMLEDLDQWATSVGSSTVVFLGDNLYDNGLTDDDRERGERILAQQLAATSARMIVIPGNHDWGLLAQNQNVTAIRNQQAFVDDWPTGRAEFIPKEGCMGPTSRILFEGTENEKAVVFIAMDPTPWLNQKLREACPTTETDATFLASLDALLGRHHDDFVIVGSHYPMLTGGPHGGFETGFRAARFLLRPGWIAPHGFVDTIDPRYADWIAQTQAVLSRNPPEVYAAGHDHSLQLLDAGEVAGLYLVSGAGSRDRVSSVTHLPETIFAHAAPGFVIVDFGSTEGRETVIVRVLESSASNPVFEMEIRSRR